MADRDTTKQPPHWDREQWPAEGDAPPAETPQGKTWDRSQWPGDQGEGPTERPATPPDPGGERTGGPLSGHAEPTGESHWERTERGAGGDEAG